MARNNVLDYRNVLNFLESSGKVAPDGVVFLRDITGAFVSLTDKNRPETIQRHIDYMCGMNILHKKGDVTYKIAEDWKFILDRMK